MEEGGLPPYTEARQELIEQVILVTYVVSCFWLLGLPIYIIFGSVLQIYYMVQVYLGYDKLSKVEEGSLEAEIYNMDNWFNYPVRRFFLFILYFWVGLFAQIIPGLSIVTQIALGYGAYIN